jgi:hypothetical protein
MNNFISNRPTEKAVSNNLLLIKLTCHFTVYIMDINSNFLGDDLNSDHSSGAGKVEHFSEVFEKTDVEAALAAGIFHREEVPIEAVKDHMRDEGLETR